jgi:Skp family chaperone for outer membrane proteins
MKMRNLSMSLSLLALFCVALPARGQDRPLKIAMANPFQIYTAIKETKDYTERLRAEGQRLQNEGNQRAEAINKKVQERDSMYKPDHPLYAAKTAEIDQMSVDASVWQEVTKRKQARDQKMHFIASYKKIEDAVAKVAEQEKVDLVLSTGPRELPVNVEQMTLQELDTVVGSRKIMFANKNIADLTEKVIAQLDADYSKSK